MPLGGAVTVAGIGAAKGVYDILHNAHLKKEDENALKNIKQPYYKVQDEYYQNRNEAAALAGGGLPQSTKNFITQQGQAGLSTALSYLKQAGGSPDDVSKLFSTYAGSIGSTGAADSEQHLKNIQYFMDANKELAGEKSKSFVVNELQPYEQKLKQLTESISTDKSNENAGFNQAIGSLTAGATALSSPQIYDKLFPTKPPVDGKEHTTMTGSDGIVHTWDGTKWN